MNEADIGLIGMAVMGENLALNMASKGFTVAVYNRTVAKVDDFVNGPAKGKRILPMHSLEEFCQSLKRPRKVMLMVKAGPAVDEFIEKLLPLLGEGDIIIDGGNSHYTDTIRRTRYVEGKGKLFIGTGVSGGEEGALKGPSIMPGGSVKAWPEVKEIFQRIAAHVEDGSPCCEWVGADGAGHFVKMVHNGIEYGDMQLIGEAYFMMKEALGLSAAEMHEIFAEWNKNRLDSYLIEITSDILAKRDPETGRPMVEVILDSAGQKGTGKWTTEAALDLGVPTPTTTEAVFARSLSALKAERVAASKILPGPGAKFQGSTAKRRELIRAIHDALYASKICAYAQGFALLAAAANYYHWELSFGEIALMWRGGCIIRARFLGHIKEAFDTEPELKNLLLAPFFRQVIEETQDNWRKVLIVATELGIPIPAFASALAYYDGYRQATLPANLLQAQRDYFGAHTYERVDKPGVFHSEWLKL